jgi:hypothetical protein
MIADPSMYALIFATLRRRQSLIFSESAMYHLDRRTLMHYTHAVRTIYAGEEITITCLFSIKL